jgi:hypothetical protein
MNAQVNPIAAQIIAEQERLANERSQLDQVREQIALRILPNYANRFNTQNRSIITPPGIQNTHEMIDSTGAYALMTFASINESMLTPHHSRWHSVVPSDANLLKDRETRLWFEDLTDLLFRLRYAPKANYASQKREDYMMLGAFGDGCLFIDALNDKRDKGFRYRAIHPGQIYFKENHQGIINEAFRRFHYTASQAVEHFGDALPKIIQEQAADSRRNNTIHWFVHKVSPRPDYDDERLDIKGMEYQDQYVSVTEKQMLREGGYHTFPYAISRYVTTPGEVNGRSPAMMSLPSLKSLHEMKKTVLKQGHRVTDPILLAHDDGVADAIGFKPGTVVSGGVNADGKPLVHVLPTGNLAAGKDAMESERMAINDFFLVNMFQILVDSPQKTATQVIEEAREKGALLTPYMGRQQSESFGPQVEREIDLARQQRLLKPMPPALLEAAGQYTVQYDSPLSRMARAEQSAGLWRTLENVMGVIQVTQDPTPLDHYDWDVIIPEISDDAAIPVRWRKSMAQVQAMRAGRQQQMDDQQAIQAAPAASNVMKTLMAK